MSCPKCHTEKTLVTDTRGPYRKRRCEHCGATWETREVLVRGTVKGLEKPETEPTPETGTGGSIVNLMGV